MESSSLLEETEAAPSGGNDDEAHDHEQQVIMPAVAGLAPEAGVPDEDLLLNGTEHDQDEPERRELREDTKGNTNTSGELCQAQKASKPGTLTDAFAPSYRVFHVAPTAGDEDRTNQQTHKEQCNVDEAGELRKGHDSP